MKQKRVANSNSMPQKQSKATSEAPSRPLIEVIQSFLHNKYLHLALLAIVGLVFYIQYNAVFDKKLDNNGDNIHYYSLGKSLHDGTGYSNVMGFEVSPHTHFPPGYPAFISVLMNFTDSGNFTPIKKANGWLLCFSIFLLFYILKRITNNNVILVFAAVILCCLQRDLLRWASIMMSEMLFLFLTTVVILTALLLYKKNSFKEYTKWDYAALVVMMLSIAYIYFVRTMGISMILGLLGWFATLALFEGYKYWKKNKSKEDEAIAHRGRIVYYLSLIGLVLLPFGIAKFSWDARNKAIGHEKSDYLNDFKMKGGNGEKMTTFSDWTDRIYSNAKNYEARLIPDTVLGRTFDQKEPITTADKWVGFLVFVFVMLGFWGLGWGGFLIFCYMVVTFAVLLVWPEQYTSVRYYVAVIPFLLFLFVHGAYNVIRFVLSKALRGEWMPYATLFSTLAASTLLLYFLAPAQVQAQTNYRILANNSFKKVYSDQNFLNFYAALDWCKVNIPDSARMVCRKPELYYINTGFKHSTSFPNYAPEDSVINYLNKVKATHIILDNWFKHAYVTLYPAIKKYPEKFKVLHKIADVDTVKKINPVYIAEYNYDWGYHGELVDGKKEGKGLFNYQDGRKYDGYYHNDVPDGQGTMYDETGKVIYSGTWKAGQYDTGKGTAYFGDKIYEGDFKGGRPNGYGVYSDTAHHVIAKGIWKDGTLVQTTNVVMNN